MAAKPSAAEEPPANPGAENARPDKTPRTARGRATLRKLLDAAAIEFGERGFHEASISGITRRAGTALGSFYTYFDSKDDFPRAGAGHVRPGRQACRRRDAGGERRARPRTRGA